MKFKLKSTVIALALVGSFGGASATALVANVLTPGVDEVSGATVASWGGTLLDSYVANVSTPSYTGIARTAVYQTTTGLDFYYQFSNDATSSSGIERFIGYDYSALNSQAINVFQTSSAFGIFAAGTESSDYADRTNYGVLAFSFVPVGQTKVNPGLTSYTQIIRTNATAYTQGNFGIADGYTANTPGFAPMAPVPEPETYAMLLAGLGLIGTIIRRRNSKQG